MANWSPSVTVTSGSTITNSTPVEAAKLSGTMPGKNGPRLITPALVACLRQTFRLEWQGLHGAAHWARVRRNGLHLAQLNGANSRVVEYFAVLHDACRESDGHDAMHGPRAADFACTIRARHIHLDGGEFSLLIDAIAGHTHGHDHDDVTVRTCWDADRLDLARVGITPDPLRLCTAAARDPDTIARASAQAERRLDKSSFSRCLGDRNLLEAIPDEMKTGAFRPAQLFRKRP